ARWGQKDEDRRAGRRRQITWAMIEMEPNRSQRRRSNSRSHMGKGPPQPVDAFEKHGEQQLPAPGCSQVQQSREHSMKRIGLALSGGGFRASLYHLGLVRFLRDAGILPQVTHITSVSGGSIMAAHLVLNWGRYNGSPGEFDAAAAEFLAFMRLDVRNR